MNRKYWWCCTSLVVLQGVQDGFHEFKVQGGQLVVEQLKPFQGVQVVEGVRWDLGYAEIHIKQYPLDMGRKNTTKSSSSVVPLKVNEKGEVQYDAILRENMRKEQIVKFHIITLLSLHSISDI